MPCLTGCYPCRFLDWNCNSDISETSWSKKTENCTSVQRKIAVNASKIQITNLNQILNIRIINEKSAVKISGIF